MIINNRTINVVVIIKRDLSPILALVATVLRFWAPIWGA